MINVTRRPKRNTDSVGDLSKLLSGYRPMPTVRPLSMSDSTAPVNGRSATKVG